MGYTRYSHATVSRTNPQALGCCDRCGFDYNLVDLHWQFDWAGPRLQNKRILICDSCLDEPQEQLRTIIIPADPLPVPNARQDPNMYMGQSSAQSAINNSSENVTPTPAYVLSGYEGYPPTPMLTFDSASTLNVALFNSGLTAINSGTATAGAKVISPKTAGSWYIEYRLAAMNGVGGSGLRCGVDLDGDSYATAISTASNGSFVDNTGIIWAQGTNSGYSLGNLQQGENIGIAVNADQNLAWFRKTPGGYWNGSVTADPYTGVGGVTAVTGSGADVLLADDGSPLLADDGQPILVDSGVSIEPYVTFGGANATINNAWTVNTDAQTFTGRMPFGYQAWSATSPSTESVLYADTGSPLLADIGSPILTSS